MNANYGDLPKIFDTIPDDNGPPEITMQKRFETELEQDQAALAGFRKLVSSSAEQETIRFFLLACCGASLPVWDIGASEAAPWELSEGEIQKIARDTAKMAEHIGRVLEHEDAANPIDFLVRQAQSRDEMTRYSEMWKLPEYLQLFSDVLYPWWQSSHRPMKVGAINQNYLQAHFRAYTETICPKLTYREMASLMGALGESASALTPTDESLKAIVSSYRKSQANNFEGMKKSVRRYLDLKQISLANGKTWTTTYVAAAGYVRASLPMHEVSAPLKKQRRKPRGK